jgi:deoxyribodipyrimidine photolyase-related protein
MSNFKKGDWEPIWDALFWRFMDVHRDFFNTNPRLAMLLGNYDKMDASKKEDIHATAQGFLEGLDAG